MQKNKCPPAHTHGVLPMISRPLKPTSKQGRGMFEVLVSLESLDQGEVRAPFLPQPREILRGGPVGQVGATAAHPAPTCGALNLGGADSLGTGLPTSLTRDWFRLWSSKELGAPCPSQPTEAAALNPFPVVPRARSRLRPEEKGSEPPWGRKRVGGPWLQLASNQAP